jgi:hypothetical protein
LEYRGLTHDADERLLVDARHVTIRPLAAADIVAYLIGRFGGRDHVLPARWKPVEAALHANGAILGVLQNPWQLFLAVTAYAEEVTRPEDLLPSTAEQVEDHLLEELIPAVVEQNRAADDRWTATEVESWLRNIARHQQWLADELGDSPTDIHLPDLWWMSGRRYPRYVPMVIAASIGVASTIVLAFDAASSSSLRAGTTWILTLVAAVWTVGLAWGAFDRTAPLTRLDLVVLAERSSRQRLMKKLRRSLVTAGAGSLAIGLTGLGLSGAARVGLLFGAGAFLGLFLYFSFESVSGETGAASSPSELAEQCINYSVGLWFVTCFSVAFVVFVALAASASAIWLLAVSVGLGAVGGTAIWLSFGGGSVWLRYAVGARSAIRQGLLPRRPARFLDWCVNAGLMRMSGNNIQFRHAQLQRWLMSDESEVATAAPTR